MATQTKSYKTEATAKGAMTKQGLSEEQYRPVLIESQAMADERGYDHEVVGRYVIESVEDDWTAQEGELRTEDAPEPTIFDQTFKSAGHAQAAAAEAGLKKGTFDLKRNDDHSFRLVPVEEQPAPANVTTTPPWEANVESDEDDDDAEDAQLPSIEELREKQAAAPAQNTLKANRSESTVESPVKVTHDICARLYDEAAREGKPQPRRKDLIAAAEAAGVAYWTARTQVQVWLKKKNSAVQAAMQASAAAQKAALTTATTEEPPIEELIEEQSPEEAADEAEEAVPGLEG